MNELFSAFGIDWRLLMINIINFGLLLFLLYYFLYGRLIRVLEERREKIAKGIQDAQEAEEKLKGIQDARASMLADAGKEADSLITSARASASAKQKEIITAGETAAANVIRSAEAQAAEMKQKAIAESKQEVAKLIVLGMEKVGKK